MEYSLLENFYDVAPTTPPALPSSAAAMQPPPPAAPSSAAAMQPPPPAKPPVPPITPVSYTHLTLPTILRV